MAILVAVKAVPMKIEALKSKPNNSARRKPEPTGIKMPKSAIKR